MLIDALPLFDDVPEDVLSELAGRVRSRSIPRGKPIVRQGERAEGFYVVRSGTLEIVEENPQTGNERVLRVLGRGEAFGELGLLEAAPRTATVRALEESQVFEIDKGAFERLLADMANVPAFEPTLQAVQELGEMPVFAFLEADECAELLRHGDWVNFHPGEQVIEQGGIGDAFYAVRSGQLEGPHIGSRRVLRRDRAPARYATHRGGRCPHAGPCVPTGS
jgi:CRP-like cAMP-binding protein